MHSWSARACGFPRPEPNRRLTRLLSCRRMFVRTVKAVEGMGRTTSGEYKSPPSPPSPEVGTTLLGLPSSTSVVKRRQQARPPPYWPGLGWAFPAGQTKPLHLPAPHSWRYDKTAGELGYYVRFPDDGDHAGHPQVVPRLTSAPEPAGWWGFFWFIHYSHAT